MGSLALTLSLIFASLLNVHASNTTDDVVSKGDDDGGMTVRVPLPYSLCGEKGERVKRGCRSCDVILCNFLTKIGKESI